MNLHEALTVIARYGIEIAPPHRNKTTKAADIAAAIGGTTGRKKRSRVTDETIDTAIRMRNEGSTWTDVSAVTGHHPTTLRKHIDG